MINQTPPQLSQGRIDQMISTAMAVKQEEKKFFWDFLKPLLRPPIGYGLTGALVTASIVGILWISPAATPVQHPVHKTLATAEVNDMMLYDLFEDLS